MRGAARREFRFERGLCPRPRLGEDSEGAIWAPSDETLQMGPHRRSASSSAFRRRQTASTSASAPGNQARIQSGRSKNASGG